MTDNLSPYTGNVKVYLYGPADLWIVKTNIEGPSAMITPPPLTIATDQTSDRFGQSVAMSSDGKSFAVAAPYYLAEGKVGLVRVYKDDSGTGDMWLQVHVDIRGTASIDDFGTSVALSSDGTKLTIGASQHVDGTEKGYARIYERDAAVWTQIGADIVGLTINAQFGASVAMSSNGSVVAIGAPHGQAGDDTGPGELRVFKISIPSPPPPPPSQSMPSQPPPPGPLATAEATRDDIVQGITDSRLKKMAELLADAAISRVVVDKLTAKFTASDADVACSSMYTAMNRLASDSWDACVATVSSSKRRRILATSTYDVTTVFRGDSPDPINPDAAKNLLIGSGAQGVTAQTSLDPIAELRKISGIDVALVDRLETEINEVYGSQPAPPGSSSPDQVIEIITILFSIGLLAPPTALGILACFFGPYLRKKLIARGYRRLADFLVPDPSGELLLLEGKLQKLEAFMAKQKLPRLVDITPEISTDDITLDAEDVLGSGGYGAVFKATHNGQSVAVKAMFAVAGAAVGAASLSEKVPASVVKSVRREAMIMCSLNHPNILRVFGVVPERAWIVMELCEGGALDTLLRDIDEELDRATMARIAAETATGIAYLHLPDVSIVHGDMKAGNVLLTKDRSVRICDFGMSEAKNRSRTMTAANVGRSGAALTVAWSAPELFEDAPKSNATDVYALGVTLWEIYERRVPFGNMPEAAVVSQVMQGKRPGFFSPVEGVDEDHVDTPATLRRIIEACWSAKLKERPPADKVAYILTELANPSTDEDEDDFKGGGSRTRWWRRG